MQVIWTDAAVQSALIQSAGGIIAALIAAIAAAVIGKRFADQQQLKKKVAALLSDLHFLLEVESLHCQQSGHKRIIRGRARENGFTWSGRFTPGRVASDSR